MRDTNTARSFFALLSRPGYLWLEVVVSSYSFKQHQITHKTQNTKPRMCKYNQLSAEISFLLSFHLLHCVLSSIIISFLPYPDIIHSITNPTSTITNKANKPFLCQSESKSQ